MSDAQPLRIGQVAKLTGLCVDAIRLYEKSGLLPSPERTGGGYRLYHPPEMADLKFIQKAQQLGFSLNEIRELFSIQRHPHEICEHVSDMIAQKLTVVRQKIAELKALEAGLGDALLKCRKALHQPAKDQKSCPVLRAIGAGRPLRKQL